MIYIVYGIHEGNTLLRIFRNKSDAEEYISSKPLSENDYDGFEYYDYMILEHKLY